VNHVHTAKHTDTSVNICMSQKDLSRLHFITHLIFHIVKSRQLDGFIHLNGDYCTVPSISESFLIFRNR